MASATLTVRVDARWMNAWVRGVRLLTPILVPLIGADRTFRLGIRGIRLLRMDVGRGWFFYRS